MVWSLWKSPMRMFRNTKSIRFPRPTVFSVVCLTASTAASLLPIWAKNSAFLSSASLVSLSPRFSVASAMAASKADNFSLLFASIYLPFQILADRSVEGSHVVIGDRPRQLAARLLVVRIGLAGEDPLGDVEIRYAGKPFLLHVLHRHPRCFTLSLL